MDRTLKAIGVSLVVALVNPALIVTPATAISADLARKCRAMAIKTYPPKLPGAKKGTAQAERTFFQQCIANGGKATDDDTRNNAAPLSK